jgi:predicted PurR-regulated permease PerM
MDEPRSPQFQSHHVARMVLAGGLILIVLWVVRVIFVAVAWALVLAISTWPLYCRLCNLLGRRDSTLAALIFTLVAGGALIGLMVLVLAEVSRDGSTLLDWLRQAQQSGIPVPAWVSRLTVLGSSIDSWWRLHLSSSAGIETFLEGIDQEGIAAWTGSVGGQVLHRILLTALTLMTLFFLLRDGEWAGDRLLVLANGWFGNPGERLAQKIAEAVRGTVNGTIIVALGEGLLIGAAYWVAGVPHAVLFGVLTTMFALVPFGAWIAFAAAALTLFVTSGSIIGPVCLVAFSSAVMLLGDNIVQPALIGGATRLPFLWTLFGIIGGLESFGLIGLFIGPVLMATLLTIWREWADVSPAQR